MSPRHPGRRIFAVLMTAAVICGLAAAPAAAEPGDDTGDEGANATLTQVLDESTRAWIEAKDKFDASVKSQAEFTTKLAATEAELARVTEQVSAIAVAAYRTGPLTTFVALMDSGSPTGFAERAGSIDEIAHHNDHLLRDLNRLKKEQSEQKAALAAEVATQQEQVNVMAVKKKEAEKGLAQAGGPSNGFVSANLPLAQPSPRNAKGGWTAEGCKVKDPTTSGCITQRTKHAMEQAQVAGFKRFVSCYRPSGPYEHPKGRACDFSVQPQKGFGGVAAGEDKVYGANLATYFVKNADRLGIMYVIWFKQVWTPAVGWHHYSGVGGDPSSDHTNHVHLSML